MHQVSVNAALKGCGLFVGGLFTIGFVAVAFAGTPVPTTLEDFKMAGTQPDTLLHPIANSSECFSCHANFDEDHEPGTNWAASMMAQSMRDPIFLAAMTVANQDADFAGDLCLRCHTPSGWLAGRSTPTDGSALEAADFDGVNCNFCHRMVDPNYEVGVSPSADLEIINNLTPVAPGVPAVSPTSGSGTFIVDHFDRRRGPQDLGENFFFHQWEQSPFHTESQMCATCHDVSNPAFDRQPDNTYDLNTLNEPHQTQNSYDQFPVERTYSEWLMSDFADGPIEMGGRFGGLTTAVSSCQDCHMPTTEAQTCRFADPRPEAPLHQFNGGNNWVIKAVRSLYSDDDTRLNDNNVAASIARAESMLERASDMELSMDGTDLNVRIINQTGHKLPSGYPEGRRMWINVQFLDDANNLVSEHGAYDQATAVLSMLDTKVYEAHLGIDSAVSALTGVPEGVSFHFAINNVRLKDNRIPPRGFNNTDFTAIQSEPVAYSYPDGQYWDDTVFPAPKGSTNARVRLYYQSISKEYIEFLRDENVTDTTGQTAYDQWVLHGKSPIVEMDSLLISLSGCEADLAAPFNGVLNLQDVFAYLAMFNAQDPAADLAAPFGTLNLQDVFAYLSLFNAGCP